MDGNLTDFFSPNSVAIIGASGNPSKLGYSVVKNLVEGGFSFPQAVYPINKNGGEILGHKAYLSVKEVPGEIDLAILVIPYPLVPDALRECGEKKIPAAIIISAGFREAGMEGLERERELLDIAREFHIRIIGPNCLGIIDTYSPINASFAAGMPPSGPMAFMSQSGALGTAVLDIAMGGRLGLSKFVSLGNKADVNEIDLLLAWENDPHTSVIMIYTEGMPNGQEFINVARKITRHKPVIAIKSGVTQSGSRAVSSHTGSLAGSEQAYQAAFNQAGILRADSMESLFDMALAIGYQPLLKGNNIAIVTNAGGPGILATDALERAGLSMAQLQTQTIQSLEQYLPDAASAANPVDVLGDAKADRYRFALERVIKDPHVDGLMVLLTPQAMTEIEETAQAVCEINKIFEKPVLACFMGDSKVKPGIEILSKNGIPNYAFPEKVARAFEAMADYRDYRERPLPEYVNFNVNKSAVKTVFNKVRNDKRVTIGDAESREVLSAYGLSIPQSQIAETAEDAVAIANKIGFPVVLKIASPEILHKTDVGGVKVNLQNAEDVRDAFELMVYRAQRYVPGARIWGCLVQQMAPAGGTEILVGMNRDPQFGPLITFGLGGIFVETIKDVTFRIAPISSFEAEQMINEIRASALLNGVRGKPPLDKEAIKDVLLRISQLVQDFSEISEMDINPLVVYPQGQGAIALDMRLVLT